MTKKCRVACLAVFFLALSPSVFATITASPPDPNVEQTVTFALTLQQETILENTVQWNFGNGKTASGSVTAATTYLDPDSFTVRVDYQISVAIGSPFRSESIVLQVVERRKISSSPSAPAVGQSVTFLAENFLSSSIRWNFGDGTPSTVLSGLAAHTFSSPGTFIVEARDFGGSSVVPITASIVVNVDISRRKIHYSPLYPAVNRPVTFTAENFYTSEIKWDFGDGSAPTLLSTVAAHTYSAPGTYTISAWDWWGAQGGATSVQITVGEERGPRAAFQVYFLQLRFRDGKSYLVTTKDFRSLVAVLDLKCEGTGTFQAWWLLDGVRYKFFTRDIPFAGELTLDTGDLPGLPTTEPGLHEVSLEILSPRVEFEEPVIRYFVTTEEERYEPSKAEVHITSTYGLKGVECVFEAGRFQVPAGSYFILQGSILNRKEEAVPFALLRIYLENSLTDQQLVRDFQPGESREFATSLFNPGPGLKRIYIALYDISAPAAVLLFFQKLEIQE